LDDETTSVTLLRQPTTFLPFLLELDEPSSTGVHRLGRSGGVQDFLERPVGGRFSASRSRRNESALR
jgi:hypothetical protein